MKRGRSDLNLIIPIPLFMTKEMFYRFLFLIALLLFFKSDGCHFHSAFK